MALIEWQSRFSVDVPAIDEQHKKLVSLINALHDAMLAGKGSEVQKQILADLIRYTQNHFDAEEAFMRSVQYPHFAEHRLNHEKMTREVILFRKNVEQGNLILSMDLMDFLRNWLQNHILSEDLQYAAWVKQQKASHATP